jgi:hypothetical protein
MLILCQARVKSSKEKTTQETKTKTNRSALPFGLDIDWLVVRSENREGHPLSV